MALDLAQYKLPTTPTVPPAPGSLDLSKYKLPAPAQPNAVGSPERFDSVIGQDPLTQAGIGAVKGVGSTLKSLGTIGQTVANQTVGLLGSPPLQESLGCWELIL